MSHITLGPPRRYAPVCVLEWHGFSGGPASYREVDAAHEGPIIVEPESETDEE